MLKAYSLEEGNYLSFMLKIKRENAIRPNLIKEKSSTKIKLKSFKIKIPC